MRTRQGEWQVWIDTGGTFTDCLAQDAKGRLHRAKVLSNSALRGVVEERLGKRQLRIHARWKAPVDFICGFEFCLLDVESERRQVVAFDADAGIVELDGLLPEAARPGAPFEVRSSEEAPLLAARLATGTAAKEDLPSMAMRLATTRGTNALLERRGVGVALFITRGLGDLLRIGNQQRPELFALKVEKPPPLYEAVVEVDERLEADGSVLRELDCGRLTEQAQKLLERGIRTAAVALMHSYCNRQHEEELAAFLRDCGFEHVVCSAELAPFIKLLPRAETAVVDAYLGPLIGDYLAKVKHSLEEGRLHVMTSAGGLLQTASFRAKDGLLSGPAGGVAGAALIGRQAGYEHVISFDMGGTSTDVARYQGDFEYLFEHQVGDAHLVAPALAIETVAAGGGSICHVANGRLRVGPQSAGAQPGPAAYGAGGPLTLTDVNLLLGRLEGERFGIPIVPERARRRLDQVRQQLAEETGEEVEPEKLLEGFLDIANERMADAIRRISLQRGHDPAAYALVAFGGAGAQHACGVASRLGISTVLVPTDAGLLSALGLGHAVIERFAERQVLMRLDQVEERLEEWLEELAEKAREQLVEEGVPTEEAIIRRRLVDLRFAGQDTPLTVECRRGVSLAEAFVRSYQEVYGHRPEGRPVEVESIRVIVSAREKTAREKTARTAVSREAIPEKTARVWTRGRWAKMAIFDRSSLHSGMRFAGPALVFEAHSATFVENGWEVEVDGNGTLVLRHAQMEEESLMASRPEAVRLELFTNGLRGIAQQMGTMLQRTALSTNVKERLDFSCALLDADGELVVNAPHIPVHLGALGLCVRQVCQTLELEPGDAVVTNHPQFGGSHLPDITLITPAFSLRGKRIGYVASRAHHAEIGGMRPGSMPPMATCLEQEGVVIAPTHLARSGKVDWETIRSILGKGPYPSRSVEENIADLNAALAANHRGMRALQELAQQHGDETVLHYMASLKKQAEQGVRAALARLADGLYEATEELDDGSLLQVKITIRGERAEIDFAGTAPVHPGNLNATPAIVRSAVIYVLRLLVEADLPLNEGFMAPVGLKIPTGCILNPDFSAAPGRAPAVVGGNVETSQRLVDTLLKALGLAACSQGTMNNVLFGGADFGYYETVCGGCGAGPDFVGADAVHSHMTNTRITDPEIIEHRYPVRVERFAIRRGSGGNGQHRGGDGAVRELVFLEGMSLSLLTQHRKEGPYGMAGGKSGKPGKQTLIRTSGERVEMDSVDGCEVSPGDRLELKTPGGGGYGSIAE